MILNTKTELTLLEKSIILLFLLGFLRHSIKSYINYNYLFPEIRNKNNKHITIEDIFNSRELFINEENITDKYIRYIRSLTLKNNSLSFIKENEKVLNLNFKDRDKKSTVFVELCVLEKLINSQEYRINEIPLISIILPSFNKEQVILKSIRSIQNQSFKNIEIIIVDDCSTDNSQKYYNYLLKTDPRIRIFRHSKNMGVWRTRIDGFLYSRGKYVIHFDPGDLYADEFVLEDSFNLAEKHELDSIRMLFKEISNYKEIEKPKVPKFPKNAKYNKIVYSKNNIIKYNKEIFKNWGTLWTRFTRDYVFTKGLFLLSSRILNIYKNFWEDLWWNKIADEVSENLLIIKRYAYIYYFDGKGEGTRKLKTKFSKNKMIQEYIYFLYFDLEFLPEKDNKTSIINLLRKYNDKNEEINLDFFISNFYIIDDLIYTLLRDKYMYLIMIKNFLRN